MGTEKSWVVDRIGETIRHILTIGQGQARERVYWVHYTIISFCTIKDF